MVARLKMNSADATHLLRQLSRIEGLGPEVVEATVRDVTEATKQIAQASMVRANGPSAPGSAPHSQTGELAESIRAIVRRRLGKVTGRVGTNLVKGYFLEFGTSSMEPRPWLFPAFEEASIRAEGLVKDNFEAAL